MTQTTRQISTIARDIRKDWGDKVNYAAKPYLSAMICVSGLDDSYGADSAKALVTYFLSNASSYRGTNAKLFKAELKKAVGIK